MRPNTFYLTVGFIICIGTLSLVAGCQPATVAVPDQFERWNSNDGSFAIEYPAGWEAKGSGNKSRGTAYARFENGAVKIRIDASFQDAVLGDLADMGGGTMLGDEEMDFTENREQKIHKFWLKHYQDKYNKFVEDEEGVASRVKLGANFTTRFSAVDGFAKLKGIRSTITSRDRGVTFFASCPEHQWKDFEPVFQRMLESMTLGVEKL